MLASLISPHITGHYGFTLLPISLPSSVVEALLSASWSTDAFLSSDELAAQGVTVPSAGEGRRWVVVQAGQQKGTGPSGGKQTFFEAKLEIPFLRHPLSSSAEATTFKHTLLFSSHMMALSSNYMIGLRSHKATIRSEVGRYEVEGWFSLAEEGSPSAEGWTEELVRQSIGGWWAGERTGSAVTRFKMTPSAPPSPSSFRLSINLADFLRLPSERVAELMKGEKGFNAETGSLEVEASGWKLEEATGMEVKQARNL